MITLKKHGVSHLDGFFAFTTIAKTVGMNARELVQSKCVLNTILEKRYQCLLPCKDDEEYYEALFTHARNNILPYAMRMFINDGVPKFFEALYNNYFVRVNDKVRYINGFFTTIIDIHFDTYYAKMCLTAGCLTLFNDNINNSACEKYRYAVSMQWFCKELFKALYPIVSDESLFKYIFNRLEDIILPLPLALHLKKHLPWTRFKTYSMVVM